MVKKLPANAEDLRDTGSIPGSGRSPGRGYSNPLQYSCLENPMDRGAWRATDHGVTKGHDGSDLAYMHLNTITETSAIPHRTKTHRSRGQKRELRSKPTHLWSLTIG